FWSRTPVCVSRRAVSVLSCEKGENPGAELGELRGEGGILRAERRGASFEGVSSLPRRRQRFVQAGLLPLVQDGESPQRRCEIGQMRGRVAVAQSPPHGH